MNKPKLLFSIIIPTFNRIDQLHLCVKNLSPNVQNISSEMFETIISNDSNFEISSSFSDLNIKIVEGPKKGPAANRNNGASFAKGEWLIFLDDDILPDFNLLKNYLLAINSHLGVGAFEGAIYPDDWQLLNVDMAECPVNVNGGSFWSANVCIKKELFIKIGGFDEQYLLAAQEDQDIYRRLLDVTEIIFVKSAKVIHPVRIVKFKQKIIQSRVGVINWFNYNIKTDSYIKSILKGYSSQISSFFHNFSKFKFKSALCNFYVILIFLPTICINNKLFNAQRKN